MRVSLIQKRHELGNKQNNLDLMEEITYDLDTDILIFPELFLTGYSLRDRLWEEAEEIPGPSTDQISELAVDTDSVIIFGMPEKLHGKGRLYNVAITATPDGGLHAYRKSYLPNFGPFEEMRYFESNDDLMVVDTPYGKLGLLICYDIFFPELSKSLALKGVDMIAYISASPSISKELFERVIPTRAIETTSYVFYANLIGREDNMVFWGGDRIVSPTGSVLAKGTPYKEEIVELDIDIDEVNKARRARPLLSDTRPEMMYEAAESSLYQSE